MSLADQLFTSVAVKGEKHRERPYSVHSENSGQDISEIGINVLQNKQFSVRHSKVKVNTDKISTPINVTIDSALRSLTGINNLEISEYIRKLNAVDGVDLQKEYIGVYELVIKVALPIMARCRRVPGTDTVWAARFKLDNAVGVQLNG
ncbi:unnamed protein product [Acanthoscelides obtectus]|uniref:Uncharacterized protein n=1 Tax=Acanthoscelides obtectus TaxID=200917 RepID=A0A9P0KVD4_ACAOB|nr:unnamed protein product [Acanthoscelides obtectus]CAK1647709.1 hypothetical protein AOBTE_LOCUS15358 [Acanthoscelides obtectus]